MFRLNLLHKRNASLIKSSFRAYKLSNYQFIKQRSPNTYALAAELQNNKDVSQTKPSGLIAKLAFRRHLISTYTRNLIPSIFYEKKPPKGKLF